MPTLDPLSLVLGALIGACLGVLAMALARMGGGE
jgi:hypothetical protein